MFKDITRRGGKAFNSGPVVLASFLWLISLKCTTRLLPLIHPPSSLGLWFRVRSDPVVMKEVR